MDHAIIRPSQSLVKGGGPAAQFRLDDGAPFRYFSYKTIHPVGFLGYFFSPAV